MSGKVLGWYGQYGMGREFHCAACGAEGLEPPVVRILEGEGLDYAREQCAKCEHWVDEDGDDNG